MKKLNQNGLTHLLVVAFVAIVFGVAGLIGYKVYNNGQLEAQAASYGSYTQVTNSSNNVVSTVRACAKSINTAYGPQWEIRSYMQRTSATGKGTVYATIKVVRNGKSVHVMQHSLSKQGVTQNKSVFVSKILTDTLYGIQRNGEDLQPAQLAACP